ncbi:MAG: hypothetical protein QHJ73_16805, partial [Armatimonadota bacterium]|nr:hypothetical protein [Armatimonadota bacterium]
QLFFALVLPGPAHGATAGRCLRLAPNAAALALPTPALACVGKGELTDASLAVLATDHLFGMALQRASAGPDAPLLTSSTPVDIEWNFSTGDVHVVAPPGGTTLQLAASLGRLRVDGRATGAAGRGPLVEVKLAGGRHRLQGVRPLPQPLALLQTRLANALTRGEEQRRSLLAAARPVQTAPTTRPASFSFATKVGGKVVDLVLTTPRPEALVAAAEGKTVHLMSPDGREIRRFSTDGAIRRLHWWPEHRLLLAGCVDEKVIAFDESGTRRWVFVSEMDPAVFEAAKQYWFKSAPGHEGIHGLDTGVFLNGESQCFVGSACTLEILNGEGRLVKRLPVFWGTGSIFRVVDARDGSLNLLVGRSLTDGPHLAIVNNRSLRVTGSGFASVPPGSTFVGGWASMNRSHLFYEDLDGNGAREVVSEINGSWNRVTVWKADGTPLYDANFGPGASIPAKNIRALDLVDLQGDGTKEILVATSSGLIVALDHRCQKVWARRLPAAPTVMKALRPEGGGAPSIVAGCEGGRVFVLDAVGAVVQEGDMGSTPTCLTILQTPGRPPLALFGTEGGEVRGMWGQAHP